jgi:hypothetical protein
LVEAGIPDDRIDAIPVKQCSVKRLQNECSNSLATAVTVCSVVPGIASALGADSTEMADMLVSLRRTAANGKEIRCSPES